MGGTVSSGQDNDELVDKLMISGYISTKQVELVFRAVDRADYVLPSCKENAYKDIAWKHGNIHLSAPCIYSKVMECLSLEPGLSFLNLGSGTGYLSTMAGLILNQHGINHGIELHEDCLRYAYERLEEFKQKSLALDEFDFCEPLFIQGNCLSVVSDRQYDRVYCGAACPESHEAFIKQFVRVGGILVMPFKDHLLRVQRIDENVWSQHPVIPVSFTTLVVPSAAQENLVHLPEWHPLSLQDICRGKIRHLLRENVWREHGELETTKAIVLERQGASSPKRTCRRFAFPATAGSDESLSDGEAFARSRKIYHLDLPENSITEALLRITTGIEPIDDNDSRCNQNSNSSTSGNSEGRNETTEELTPNSEDTTESSSDSTCDESGNQSRKLHNRKPVKEKTAKKVRSDMSDSDNKSEEEETLEKSEKPANCKKINSSTGNKVRSDMSDNDNESEEQETLEQSKKPANCKKISSPTGNKVHLDMCDSDNESEEEETLEQSKKPANCKKISSPTGNNVISNSEMGCSSSNRNRSDSETVGHYVNSNAFSTYMKEKIHELPLPFSLKLYINYNRKLETK